MTQWWYYFELLRPFSVVNSKKRKSSLKILNKFSFFRFYRLNTTLTVLKTSATVSKWYVSDLFMGFWSNFYRKNDEKYIFCVFVSCSFQNFRFYRHFSIKTTLKPHNKIGNMSLWLNGGINLSMWGRFQSINSKKRKSSLKILNKFSFFRFYRLNTTLTVLKTTATVSKWYVSHLVRGFWSIFYWKNDEKYIFRIIGLLRYWVTGFLDYWIIG